MAATSDTPLHIPAQRFSTDEKEHRANNSALELFSQISYLAFVPIGGIIGYAGNTAPPGWLECNGAAINRRAYKELFSITGTDYGAGNGSTTFNVPTRAQASAIFGGSNAAATNGIMIIRTGAF